MVIILVLNSNYSVNNAGIMESKTLEQIDETFFDDHINLNVKGPLFLTQAAVKYMAPGTCGLLHVS